MARYQEIVTYSGDSVTLDNTIKDYLKNEGFNPVNYKGTTVYKKGIGFLTAPQYLNYTIQDGKVLLEAWIKWTLFPGVFIGESSINGYIGGIPKKHLSNRVDSIRQLIIIHR